MQYIYLQILTQDIDTENKYIYTDNDKIQDIYLQWQNTSHTSTTITKYKTYLQILTKHKTYIYRYWKYKRHLQKWQNTRHISINNSKKKRSIFTNNETTKKFLLMFLKKYFANYLCPETSREDLFVFSICPGYFLHFFPKPHMFKAWFSF